jgi:hypothetical protein
LEAGYSEKVGAVAAYDVDMDTIILPTGYRARDLARVVFHELGHALTLPHMTARPRLLENLPQEISDHVRRQDYVGRTPSETARGRVAEALAEGYRFLLLGRESELSAALLSELRFMLSIVSDGFVFRFEFDIFGMPT